MPGPRHKGYCPLKGGHADLRAGRLAAHNERRQPAKLARSCGCLPRGGKHCSLPGFAPLNRGPTLTTPQSPAPTGKLTLPQSTRSGQDRSLRTAAHGCFVGRGLDPSAEVCTCRTLPGRIWNPSLRVGVDARHRPGRLALPHAPRAAYMPPLRTFPEVCRGRIYASRQAPGHRKRPGRDESLPYKFSIFVFPHPHQNGARFAAGPVLVGIGK